MCKSILIVCVGNICRSPVAERFLAEAMPTIVVGSAGLNPQVGHPVDADTFSAASEHGINLSGHTARRLSSQLGAAHDLLLVMERSHRNEIAVRMPQLTGRTMLFGQWIDGGIDIPDPYLKARSIHAQTVTLIKRASIAWAARLKRVNSDDFQ